MQDVFGGVVAVALVLTLSGCDDGAVTVADAPDEDAATVEIAWLTADDPTRPAVWLAERDLGSEPRAGEYARYGALLTRAGAHYHETPRMIANRMVQLHGELSAIPPGLTIATLLEDFAWEAGNARRQTLGEVAQHYLVLRREGRDHAAAMAALRAAYGAAPSGR